MIFFNFFKADKSLQTLDLTALSCSSHLRLSVMNSKVSKAMNWLPTKNRFDQYTCVCIMKLFKGMAPAYADKMFQPIGQRRLTQWSKFKQASHFAKVTLAKSVYPIWGQKYGVPHCPIYNLQMSIRLSTMFPKYTEGRKQRICVLVKPCVLSRIHDLAFLNYATSTST